MIRTPRPIRSHGFAVASLLTLVLAGPAEAHPSGGVSAAPILAVGGNEGTTSRRIDLTMGRSLVIDLPRDAKEVFVANTEGGQRRRALHPEGLHHRDGERRHVDLHHGCRGAPDHRPRRHRGPRPQRAAPDPEPEHRGRPLRRPGGGGFGRAHRQRELGVGSGTGRRHRQCLRGDRRRRRRRRRGAGGGHQQPDHPGQGSGDATRHRGRGLAHSPQAVRRESQRQLVGGSPSRTRLRWPSTVGRSPPGTLSAARSVRSTALGGRA